MFDRGQFDRVSFDRPGIVHKSSTDTLLIALSETLGDRTLSSQDTLLITLGGEVDIQFKYGTDDILLLLGDDVSNFGDLIQGYDILLLAGGGDETVSIILNTFLSPCSDDLLISGELSESTWLKEGYTSTDDLLILGECDESSFCADWVDPPDILLPKITDSTASLVKREWGVDLFLKTASDTLLMKVRDNYTELWTMAVELVGPIATTWTVPAGYTRILVMAVGCGGSGGGGGNGNGILKGYGGEGGHVGQLVIGVRNVTPGQVISYEAGQWSYIGAGGRVGSPHGTQGQYSSPTIFDSTAVLGATITALGGLGGLGGQGEVPFLAEPGDGADGADNEIIPDTGCYGPHAGVGGSDGYDHPDSGGLGGTRPYWALEDPPQGHFAPIGVGGGGGGGGLDGPGGNGGRGAAGGIIIYIPTTRICCEDNLLLKVTEQPTLINGLKQFSNSDDLLVRVTDSVGSRTLVSTDTLSLKVDDPQGRFAIYSADTLSLKVIHCNNKRVVTAPGSATWYSSVDWPIPPGVTTLTVELIGGGGGGGSGGCGYWTPNAYPYGHGGIGGQPGTRKTGQIVTVVPGTTIRITVGGGGVGGWGSTPYVFTGAAGSPGGTSQVLTASSPGGNGGSGGPGPYNDSPTAGSAGANGPVAGISATPGTCGSYHYFWNGGNPYYQCMGGAGGAAGSGYGAGGGAGGGGTGDYSNAQGNQGGPGGSGAPGYVKASWNETVTYIRSCDTLTLSPSIDDAPGVKKILNTDSLLIKLNPEITNKGFIREDSLKLKVSEITRRDFVGIDDLKIKVQDVTRRAFTSQDDLLVKDTPYVTKRFSSQDQLRMKISEDLTTRSFMRADQLRMKISEVTRRAFVQGDTLLVRITEGTSHLTQWHFTGDDLLLVLGDLVHDRTLGSTDDLLVKVQDEVSGQVRTCFDSLLMKVTEALGDKSLVSTDDLLVGVTEALGDKSLISLESLIISLDDFAYPPNVRDKNNYDDLLLTLTEFSTRTFSSEDTLLLNVVDEVLPKRGEDTLLLTITEASQRVIFSIDTLKVRVEEAVVFHVFAQDDLLVSVTEAETDDLKNRTLRFISSGGTREQGPGTFRSPYFYLVPKL